MPLQIPDISPSSKDMGVSEEQQKSGSKEQHKWTPAQKIAASIATLATLVGLGQAYKSVGMDEEARRKFETEDAKRIKNETNELIEIQKKIIEEKQIIDTGNVGLDLYALGALSNEVYRRVGEEQLKPFENGTLLLPDTIALLDIKKDDANYIIDGKIKLGVYDTTNGEFRLIDNFLNYAEVQDSPEAVITWLTKTNEKLNPTNHMARYKLGIINDGEHDCYVRGGSDAIESVAKKFDSGKQNVYLNEISLNSEIVHSDNLYYPIRKLNPTETASFALIRKNKEDFESSGVSIVPGSNPDHVSRLSKVISKLNK